jgi:uncharacterized protein YuzE
MKFKETNEKLTPKQLNDLVAHLENTIPNFPRLNGRTISYDYEAEHKIISLTWEVGYHISKDHGDYIIDLNEKGEVIGIELLSFNPEQN